MRFISIFLVVCFVQSTIVSGQHNSVPDQIEKTLGNRCYHCHGTKVAEGGLNLFATVRDKDVATPVVLESVLQAIEDGSMPPADEPDLSLSQRESLVAFFKNKLGESLAVHQTYPRTPIRRMNRFQYNNAVQDLFELKPVVFSLPERMAREYGGYFQPASGKMPDRVKVGCRPLGKSQMIEPRLGNVAAFPQDLRAEHGYDNQGDHLSLSPMLMEAFLKLAQSVVNSPDFKPKNVGVWNRFFKPPTSDADITEVVKQRLTNFLTQAFRKPVDEATLNRYVRFAIRELDAGRGFTETMKLVAAAAISSPKFLYLFDRANQQNVVDKLDGFELASRLSFFLWGSIPDQRLLDLAATGEILENVVLRSEVERMLNDRKIKRFCDSFPAQWLQLDRIISSSPDRTRFSKFYFGKYKASMHMLLEPLLLFETVLVENRPIEELISPKFSYRSEMLKSWYNAKKKPKGLPPKMIVFDRVKITQPREGGVITNAAVMTMTSNPTETQPITRGAWLATVIFNQPPDPPPAEVPPLPDSNETETDNLTIREKFAAHRDVAQCAGCHARIDPLGFALENYGPTGIWRDRYENGRTVDSGGKLFDRHAFKDIVEFKSAILSEKEKFARAFSKHLISFALARKVTPTDSPAIEEIVRQAKAKDYRIRQVIAEVVASDLFQTKYNPAQADGVEE